MWWHIISRKKTTEEFIEEVYQATGKEYEVIGEYEGNKIKIEMKHISCNFSYSVRPASFISGARCPNCFGTRKKTPEEFKQEVYSLVGHEFIFLDEYETAHKKLKVYHKSCDREFAISPHKFLAGRRCSHCYRGKKKTSEEFKVEVFNIVGDEYTLLEEYVKSKENIKIKHEKCGHEYSVKPNKFLIGQRCPECSSHRFIDTEVYKRDVYKLVGEEYTVLGEYMGDQSKVAMKHNVCKHEYSATPNNFLRGRRCPRCKSSRGEKVTAKFLEDRKINYKQGFKFEDCKNKRSLPFDFYIDNMVLIEYDGEHHFEVTRHSKDKDKMLIKLKGIQRNDLIKNKFCIDNKICLIRIPFWEFDNIESILKKVLLFANDINKDKTHTTNEIKEYLVDSTWNHSEYLAKSSGKNRRNKEEIA